MKLVRFDADVVMETVIVVKEIGSGHVVLELEGKNEVLHEGQQVSLKLTGTAGQTSNKEVASYVSV